MTTRDAHTKTTRSVQSNALYLDPELVQDLHNRLHCLEGHVRGIQRMLEEQAACEDLLIQTSAVRAALNQINIKIIEGHMQAYVIECAKQGKMSAAIDELRGALGQVLKNG
jgi:DNA-binding FrmR family transcriptional regulator